MCQALQKQEYKNNEIDQEHFFFHSETFCHCMLAHSIHSHNVQLITFLREMSQNGLLDSLWSFSPWATEK